MSQFDEAMALADTLSTRISDRNRAACRAKLPGLAEAVNICNDLLNEFRAEPTLTIGEIAVAGAIRDAMKVAHDALEKMAGEA